MAKVKKHEEVDKSLEDGIRQRFLEAVDELRGRQRLTGTVIMEAVGDHQQSLAAMRRGKRYPTVKNIVLLCTEFKYSETWLLFGTGSRNKESKTEPLARLKEMEKEIKEMKKRFSK